MNKIVLGGLFGDEGKGNVVQWLCRDSKNPIVYRFSGGPQAGHRVVNNGISHICSSYGSGVLQNVPTVLTENVYIDPICIYNEYQALLKEGLSKEQIPTILIDLQCKVITPYDVLVDTTDNKVISDGSCGKGIHATFNRYKYDDMLCYAGDLQDNPKSILIEARDFYMLPVESELEQLFIDSVNYLFENNIITVSEEIYDIAESRYSNYIYEGSQGLLLDMERGFMPHCTPSKVGLNALSEYIVKDSEVYIVIRPYLTRHGNGYEPKFPEKVPEYFHINDPSNTDEGPQGKFKYGLFDFDLLYRAIDRHCLDNYQNCTFNIVVTHIDCLINNNIEYLIENQLVSGVIKDFLYELECLLLPINKIYIGKGENSIIEEYWSRN